MRGKCQYCGQEIDTHAIQCSYCKSENPEGVKYQAKVRRQLGCFMFMKPFLGKEGTLEMLFQHTTKCLVILVGINALLIGASYLLHVVPEKFILLKEPTNGTYADQFEDYKEGNFYVAMNQVIEKVERGETPTDYEISQAIECGWRCLQKAQASSDEQAKETVLLVTTFLTEYLGVTEEDVQYLNQQSIDTNDYLSNEWISLQVEKIKGKMKGGVQ